jgi:hypothetical protein
MVEGVGVHRRPNISTSATSGMQGPGAAAVARSLGPGPPRSPPSPPVIPPPPTPHTPHHPLSCPTPTTTEASTPSPPAHARAPPPAPTGMPYPRHVPWFVFVLLALSSLPRPRGTTPLVAFAQRPYAGDTTWSVPASVQPVLHASLGALALPLPPPPCSTIRAPCQRTTNPSRLPLASPPPFSVALASIFVGSLRRSGDSVGSIALLQYFISTTGISWFLLLEVSSI